MKKSAIMFLLSAFLFACSGPGNVNEEAGVATGAAVGAGAGAVVGHQSGHALGGAVIGGATGAVVGGLTGEVIDKEQERKKAEKEDKTLLRQKKEFANQDKEAQDVERQRYYDQQLDDYLAEHQ